MTWNESEMEYEFYRALENNGEMTEVINKSILKSVLVDIAKLAGKTTVVTECGADFGSDECKHTCEYFSNCVHQRAQYARTMSILQKITRL